jgi:hypothetical protein
MEKVRRFRGGPIIVILIAGILRTSQDRTGDRSHKVGR